MAKNKPKKKKGRKKSQGEKKAARKAQGQSKAKATDDATPASQPNLKAFQKSLSSIIEFLKPKSDFSQKMVIAVAAAAVGALITSRCSESPEPTTSVTENNTDQSQTVINHYYNFSKTYRVDEITVIDARFLEVASTGERSHLTLDMPPGALDHHLVDLPEGEITTFKRKDCMEAGCFEFAMFRVVDTKGRAGFGIAINDRERMITNSQIYIPFRTGCRTAFHTGWDAVEFQVVDTSGTRPRVAFWVHRAPYELDGLSGGIGNCPFE